MTDSIALEQVQPSSRRGPYARRVLERYHSQLRIPVDEIPEYDTGEKAPKPMGSSTSDVTKINIGIVGAGIAGLYTALILDWLNRDKPQFTYDILEANPSRVGGRLYTHHFKGKDAKEYDYYDVGAMRFPDIPWMKPVHDLFNYLELGKSGLILPYIMNDSLGNNISYFNGQVLSASQIQAQINSGHYDVFKTGLPLKESLDSMFGSIFGPFKKKLISKDPTVWKAGLEELFQYDDWSTRTFMRFRPDRMMDISPGRLPQEIISYLETLDTSTGNYDQAFVESVLDSVDLDIPGTKWVCINGGADIIAKKAHEELKQKAEHGKQVMAIAPDIPKGGKDVTGVRLTIHGEEKDRVYDHVISTMSLSCLSVVDMSKCDLDWRTKWPTRQLHYDASVKVAIRFSERWWEDEKLLKGAPQIGGVSSTDRPTRIVVYPSYGLKEESGATMIVSYTWAQDALRMGTGVNGATLSQEFLDTILRDLADMHQIGCDKLCVVEHHAWDWTHDKFAMGPFALFSPAQFTHLYPELTKPAFGRLHFAGEATSVHHAWVVGALYSAFRCVVEVLAAHGRKDLIKKLQGSIPFGSAGAEDDEHELSVELIGKQVALGIHEGKKLVKSIPE